VLAGRDTLCVMSTGSGKTAIYQLAGLLLDGPTIVVSPLIALQRDQVEAAEGEAELINSTLTQREREEAFEEAEEGDVEYVLLAPEQLAHDEVLARLRDAKPSLFVRRRGALRLAVGPRLPARLPRARRGHRGGRPAGRARPHRDGRAAGA